MTAHRVFLLVILVFFSGELAAQSSFSLKNTEASAVLYWWDIAGPLTAPSVFASLSLAAEKHPVAPGESVAGTLAAGRALVAVFLPWSGSTWTSVLTGGVLLASELPARGTVLVDRRGLAAANRGRELSGTVAEWGLTPPTFVLGRPDGWDTVPVLLEWGPGFQPEEGRWPAGWPRLGTLRAVDREGVLWLRINFSPATLPAVPGSLVLSRPGASLEVPWTGRDNRVWEWSEAGGRSVGSRIVSPGVLDAWIPWDRLPAGERSLWLRIPADWVLAVGGEGAVQTFHLGRFSGEDLP